MHRHWVTALFISAVSADLLRIVCGFTFTPTLNSKRLQFQHAKLLPPAHGARKPAGLTMHLGHSHSHNHNGKDLVQGQSGSTAASKPLHKKRRLLGIFVFASAVIFGVPLARHRRVGRAEVAAFVMTTVGLTTFDAVRREVKHTINKIKDIRDGIAKHSTPIDAGTLWRFFFKNDNAADRVTLMGGVINLFLSLGKFAVGITCHSSALIADAGHSLSDLFSDFITLWAVQVGRLPPDDDHPYGHGKFEAIGSLFLGMTLLGTGISVGAVSNKKLIDVMTTGSLAGQMPTMPALLMAGLSIFSKEWLYRVTRKVGEKLNSQVVIANAWHHRSDAYSSILALVAIGLAMVSPGLLAADSAAGMLVAGMICMTGMEIMGESIKQLTDTSNEDLVQQVTGVLDDSEDVFEVKQVRTRQVGSAAIADVSITTSGDLSASVCRNIEERLKYRIMDVPGVIDAEVHATSPEVVCPLLVSDEVSSHPPTAAELENEVREIAVSHKDINGVEAVTLHYQDTLIVNVDVDIRLDADVSVLKANSVADELRKSIEASSNIYRANIFLDLNESADIVH